jgi:NADH dehydrogenase
VDDLAQAAVKGVVGEAEAGVYEIGGPEAMTFRDLMGLMLEVVQRRRLVLNIPFWVARIMGSAFGVLNAVTLGLVKGPITSDQVKSLRRDNVVSENARTLADLGIKPTAMEAVLPEYLWPYRPSGQYASMKASAKNLKT